MFVKTKDLSRSHFDAVPCSPNAGYKFYPMIALESLGVSLKLLMKISNHEERQTAYYTLNILVYLLRFGQTLSD